MSCRPVPCRLRFSSVAMMITACAVLGLAIGCSGSAPPAATKTGGTSKPHDHDHDDHDHDDDNHDDHDHAEDHGHEHPTTLAGAVDAIGSRLASLEKAFTEDDHDEADSIVHEVGHLLEDGESLLAKVPEAVAAKAREAWNDLGDCLAEVDEKLHDAGDDKAAVKKAYEAAKERIEAAIQALRGHVKSVGEPAAK